MPDLEPLNRHEEFLAAAAAGDASDLTPMNREEQFLVAIAEAVAEGGGGSSADAVLYTAQTLSDLQKAQARTNIGAVGAPIVETTAETTATIDAEDNHVYECGEMSSVAISTAPSGGEFTLIFTSGATPTVLTMPVAISNR